MLKGKNNAYGSLYEAITSTDTTCKIVKPNTFTQGTSIEVPFLLTIFDRSVSDLMLNYEIVRVTAIETGIAFDTLTIERAQENTPALNHGAGKTCGNLITWGYFVDAYAGVGEAIEEAQQAVEIVSNAHLYPPYIGENGNWYVYDVANHEYIDTGDQAQGPQGPAGEGDGDMKKNVYDTNNNGIVDNSEKLGGQLPSYYAVKSEVDAHLADNAKHVNKVAFACTPKTGYTITSDKSYLINKTVYIQLVIKKTDDTTFASGNQNIVVVPYSPEINLISLNASGLDANGNLTIISQAIFFQYNKEILVTGIGTTTKTIYIAGVYTIV